MERQQLERLGSVPNFCLSPTEYSMNPVIFKTLPFPVHSLIFAT